MNKLELLKKFIKTNELIIDTVEKDDSPTQKMLKITLKRKLPSVTGSNVTPDGDPMTLKNVDVVYVATEETIEEFVNGLDEVDGTLVYKGDLKLDVSKPAGRYNRDGEYEVTKPAKVWLTKVNFNRMGGELVQKNRDGLKSVMAKLFSAGETLANLALEQETKPTPASVADKKLNPVEKVGG